MIEGMIEYLAYAIFFTIVMTVLLGAVAIYNAFGMGAFYTCVFVIIVLAFRNERRETIYTGDGGLWEAFGDSQPSLPPPGKGALPPPGAAQIGHVQRKALPAPKVK
jgi:hypothetical protein